MMEVILQEKLEWGCTKFYPKNNLAKSLANMLNQENLTEQNIFHLTNGGFDVIIDQPATERRQPV